MFVCLFREASKKSGCPFQTYLDMHDFCMHIEINIFLTFNNEYMLALQFLDLWLSLTVYLCLCLAAAF